MLSLQARLVKLALKANPNKEAPSLHNLEKYRRNFERNLRTLFPTLSSKHVRAKTISGISVEGININPTALKVHTIIYVHGGGFALGSSRAYRQHLTRLAKMCNAEVISINYPLAPEYPFPHAINQVYTLWNALSKKDDFDPSKVVLMGDSAGGNIALAATLKLKNEKKPLPSCLILLSAGLDATLSGKSYEQNKDKDFVLTKAAADFYAQTYAQSHSKKTPLISPVFADLTGLPPMLIHAASDELVLSDSIKLHKNAIRDRVDAELYIGQGMWHNWHLFAGFVPEAKDAMQSIRSYILDHAESSQQPTRLKT